MMLGIVENEMNLSLLRFKFVLWIELDKRVHVTVVIKFAFIKWMALPISKL